VQSWSNYARTYKSVAYAEKKLIELSATRPVVGIISFAKKSERTKEWANYLDLLLDSALEKSESYVSKIGNLYVVLNQMKKKGEIPLQHLQVIVGIIRKVIEDTKNTIKTDINLPFSIIAGALIDKMKERFQSLKNNKYKELVQQKLSSVAKNMNKFLLQYENQSQIKNNKYMLKILSIVQSIIEIFIQEENATEEQKQNEKEGKKESSEKKINSEKEEIEETEENEEKKETEDEETEETEEKKENEQEETEETEEKKENEDEETEETEEKKENEQEETEETEEKKENEEEETEETNESEKKPQC